MADLVNTMCTGSLSIRMPHIGAHCSTGATSTPPPSSLPQHLGLGRWLAKHACLCSSIKISIPAAPPSQHSLHQSSHCSPEDHSLLEASIAAGLALAAQDHSRMPGALQNQQLTQQHETAMMDLYVTDITSTAPAALAAPAAAAVVAAVEPHRSSQGDSVMPHCNASSSDSSSLSSGVSQLRLSGPLAATSAGVTPSSRAAAASPYAAAPHAAANPASVLADAATGGSQQQEEEEEARQLAGGSPLSLEHFTSSLPSDGRVLRALSAQTQLTSLQLCLISSGKSAAGCGAALASLSSLQSLTLNTGSDTLAADSPGDNPVEYNIEEVSAALEPALQRLTCLTHLTLCWLPGSSVCASFPPSLVSLQTGGGKSPRDMYQSSPGSLQLLQLTCLTHLDVERLDAKASLPPSLRSLHVHRPLAIMEPGDTDDMMYNFMLGMRIDLRSLPHLQHLHLYSQPQPLTIGPMLNLQRHKQLTHLGLHCNVEFVDDTSAAVLPTLPLRWLHLQGEGLEIGIDIDRGCNHILAHVGSCTQLTYLQLQGASITSPVTSLTGQLQRLPALQELQLADVRVAQPPAAACADPEGGGNSQRGEQGVESEWGPLLTSMPLLAPLRKLVVERVPLRNGDVEALGGASQLTCLRLVGCGVSEAAAARLRLALPHLLDGMLLT